MQLQESQKTHEESRIVSQRDVEKEEGKSDDSEVRNISNMAKIWNSVADFEIYGLYVRMEERLLRAKDDHWLTARQKKMRNSVL